METELSYHEKIKILTQNFELEKARLTGIIKELKTTEI
jgi:hypothetical protein